MFLTVVDGPSGRLGSEVATLDSGGLVDQFEYWPYGELVDDVPEGAPVFLWVGGLGYWFDTDERRYVRHRMLRSDPADYQATVIGSRHCRQSGCPARRSEMCWPCCMNAWANGSI